MPDGAVQQSSNEQVTAAPNGKTMDGDLVDEARVRPARRLGAKSSLSAWWGGCFGGSLVG